MSRGASELPSLSAAPAARARRAFPHITEPPAGAAFRAAAVEAACALARRARGAGRSSAPVHDCFLSLPWSRSFTSSV